MNTSKTERRALLALTILTLALCLLAGCGRKHDETITSLEQLNAPGRKIGVMSDTAEDRLVMEYLPLAQIEYVKDNISAYTAVSQGKLDAFVYDKRQMELSIQNGQQGVRVLDDTLGEGNTIAVAISPMTKIPDLEGKINAFIDELQADGTLDDIYNRWLVISDWTMPDIPVPEESPLHLTVGTTGSVPPYTYYAGTYLTGQDIELARRFAAWLGAELEFKIYDYDGIVAAALSGDVDCIMANLFVTPERRESIAFSQPTSVVEVGVMVRDPDGSGDSGAWASIRDSFQKTFIREDRWKLFVQGIGTTLLITVLSILFGTVLGFAVFLPCRNGSSAAEKITRFFVWLVEGMPVVVLLMILYYVVFGKVAISGTIVSIIGFTLLFGAAVYAMLRGGVATVDRGQTEAALALGYSDRRAFFRVVLPQALPHIMPSYKAQITATIKATAVVGYIAVLDLTKMGDIVRSRTYDAFFPLIAAAVFYFILAALLNALVSRIELRIDPKRRTREDILKGVETGD